MPSSNTRKTTSEASHDSRNFRQALCCFATGITVVTARNTEGKPFGVTVSSCNSVSLEPPLVLWSLSLNSPNLELFRHARYYAINVLAADQQSLSDNFAARQSDRFAGVPTRNGLGEAPLLEGCCASFECSNEAHYPGGDHLIFIGRVERFAQGSAPLPLVFHNARYRTLTELVKPPLATEFTTRKTKE